MHLHRQHVGAILDPPSRALPVVPAPGRPVACCRGGSHGGEGRHVEAQHLLAVEVEHLRGGQWGDGEVGSR